MEDQKLLPTNDALANKPRKKKLSSKDPTISQAPGGDGIKRQKGQRALTSKKGHVSPLFQQETLKSDSSPDSEYRALRRKYLLLEEESFGLEREMKVVEDDIKALEEEKLSLLDELVVLEGLIDPSDLQTQDQRLS